MPVVETMRQVEFDLARLVARMPNGEEVIQQVAANRPATMLNTTSPLVTRLLRRARVRHTSYTLRRSQWA
jgi:hypothetical protein